ncbi:MAG: c-type cytochrome [Gammaproteobacteria bacterium]|nr:c-type cytochrome [Gammaproteobacteria bacterium]
MRRVSMMIAAAALASACTVTNQGGAPAPAAASSATPAAKAAAVPAAAAASAGGTIDYSKITPVQLVEETPKGKLHNPYKDSDASIVAQGREKFLSYGCSGCHGGGGGGGMCPPLINDVWVYGGDDDTIFRLVTLGSVELQKRGYTRTGMENVVGPMPPFGGIIKNADDLWKIFAFVRSKYDGDPAYKYGGPPGQ